jgi:hypothetical protein
MQTQIAVKRYFLWGENNRSKLSRFRNKFVQPARVNMNEGAIKPLELARPTSKTEIGIASLPASDFAPIIAFPETGGACARTPKTLSALAVTRFAAREPGEVERATLFIDRHKVISGQLLRRRGMPDVCANVVCCCRKRHVDDSFGRPFAANNIQHLEACRKELFWLFLRWTPRLIATHEVCGAARQPHSGNDNFTGVDVRCRNFSQQL